MSTWPGWRMNVSSSENSRAVRSTVLLADRRPTGAQVELDVADDENVRLLGPGRAQPRAHAGEQLVEAEGLRHVVVGAALEEHHDVAVAPAGQHEHGDHVPARAELLEDVEPLELREPHVEDHEVELLGEPEALRLLAVVGEEGREPARPEALLEERADERVVLGDQDPGHHELLRSDATGMTIVKVEPSPRRLSSSTCPPCASATVFTIASPSPPPR